MFERFTDDARTVVRLAGEHARRLGHRYVGGEHILLAAVTAGQPASAVLSARGVTPEIVEEEIVRRVGLGAGAGLFGGLDKDALATIGIDLDAVRARIEASFGAQALARAAQSAHRDPRRRLGPRPPRLVRQWRRRRRARRAMTPAAATGPRPPEATGRYCAPGPRCLPGAEGSAAAAVLSALVFVPVGIMILVRHPPTAAALACAATAGVLSSAVPLLTDLLALRRVPAGYFGLFMSVHPVLAALIGLLILGQSLPAQAWLSIAAIVTANVVSALRRQVPAAERAAAIGLHGEDHGRADNGRARDPGGAQPLAEQQGGQDGAGQRLEQGQPGGRARGGGPQAAEIQRVGHGGRAGAQRDQQADGRRPGSEGNAPG